MVSGSCAFMSCSTSPSAITLVASAMISMTRCEPTCAIIWNAREYTKSPTSTLAWLPKMLLAVARPRRFCEPSTTSSCSSVAVCTNSMNAAASMCLSLLDAAGAAGEHAQQRAQALAAAADDVLGDLVDQRHRALEAGADHGVHGRQIGANQGADFLERHGGSVRRTRGRAREVGKGVTLELI